MKPPEPFSAQIPWWMVLASVDISKRIFCNEVACATCQWTPVAPSAGGTWRVSMTKLRTERKLRERQDKRSSKEADCTHKLFWLTYQLLPPSVGSASMMAMPAKFEAAKSVGRFFASPISWV